MGKRLPAEWEPQAATMMTWPGDQLGAWKHRVADTLLQMANALHQPILVNCNSEADMDYVQSQMAQDSNVLTTTIASNDIWARDHGPISIIQDDTPALLNFNFTGWGQRHPHQLDNGINHELQDKGILSNMQDVDLDFEGGGIDSDGNGHILLQRQWLKAHGRNPNKSEGQIHEVLQQACNAKLLYLDHGSIQGDDTDNHIDMLARFATEEVIVYAEDKNNPTLQGMQQQLQDINRQHHNRWELLPLQLPANCRHPASYINFIISNNSVIVPQYGQSHTDREACAKIKSCFPQRELYSIDSTILAEQGGGPHCASMHLGAINNERQ